MGVTSVLTAALVALALGASLLGVLVAAGRILRQWRDDRRERLAKPVRGLLFELTTGDPAETEIALAALTALDRRRWKAIEPNVLGLLAKLRGEAQVALVRLLEQRGTQVQALADVWHRSPVRRARAAQILGSLRYRDATPDLCRLLADSDPDVRLVAIRALGRIGDPSAAPALFDSLAADRFVPPQSVAQAVARLGPGAHPALAEACRHPDPLVRSIAVEIIGLTGAVTQVTAVVEGLQHDRSVEVRIRAARALGKLGMPAGLEPLLAATDRRQPQSLRTVATRALGDLGAHQAAGRLRSLLQDPAYRVAHNAAGALQQLGVLGAAALADAAAGRLGPGAAAHAHEALAMAELVRARDRSTGAGPATGTAAAVLAAGADHRQTHAAAAGRAAMAARGPLPEAR